MGSPVYGFYLRPDAATATRVRAVHALLEAQFGLRSAGLFMPHMTIRGFFRSAAEPARLHAALDAAMAGWAATAVYVPEIVAFGRSGIALDCRNAPGGEPNEALFALQDRAWAALEPLTDPACEFTPRDWRGRGGERPFRPHITLAMADIPEWAFDEVCAFARDAWGTLPIEFTGDVCDLFRFDASWDGAWWADLTWMWLGAWPAAGRHALI